MQITKRHTVESINENKPDGCRLTALKIEGVHATRRQRLVLCQCDCGKSTTIVVSDFRNGSIKSCGCLKIEKTAGSWYGIEPNIPELKIRYRSMYNRCYCKNVKGYANYGGRGVIVCDEWLNSYKSFLDWSLANGWKPGLCLDKDIKGDGMLYSPDTCKWVTFLENSRNRRCSLKADPENNLTLGDMADMYGVSYSKVFIVFKKHGLEKTKHYFENKLHLKYRYASVYFRNIYNK